MGRQIDQQCSIVVLHLKLWTIIVNEKFVHGRILNTRPVHRAIVFIVMAAGCGVCGIAEFQKFIIDHVVVVLYLLLIL